MLPGKDSRLMAVPYTEGGKARQFDIRADRLWAGGLATAVVAALIAVVGILLARGVFDVPVLAPEGEGAWGNASTLNYAIGSAVAALLATGLMHLLLLFTPRPWRFFGWIMALVTVIGVVAPFATDAGTSAKVATAFLNLVIGVAIWSLVVGTAHSAVRRVPPNPNMLS